MKHESWVAQLDAYLDGELATIAMDKLDAHLRECSECAAESLRRLQWKRTVQSAGQRYRADSALRERVRASVAGKRPGLAWWQSCLSAGLVRLRQSGQNDVVYRISLGCSLPSVEYGPPLSCVRVRSTPFRALGGRHGS